MTETQNEQQPHSFKRKLGNTTYTVKVHFSKDTDKTFKDKVQKLIINECLEKKSEIIHINTLHLLSEDSLLAAVERAGAEDMGDDVERKGMGTPATRADIIEKLVKDGFVKREKTERSSVCRLIPTDDGLKLITVLPDVVKSPKLTADWENALTLVAKRELAMEDFMADIENMVKGLVQTYHAISDEQKSMFGGGAYRQPDKKYAGGEKDPCKRIKRKERQL